MSRFDGKRVLVTGAGSGFGAAIATRFADEGARVMLSDVNAAGLDTVARQIRVAGGQCETSLCNVAEETQVEALVDGTVDTFGGIDVLVNNAGYSHHQKLMWKISVEEFDAVFAVNVRGVFLGCKHVVPRMIATKGAVLTMTKGLAMECARHNIRVNAVNPVAADTGFMKGAMGVDSLDAEATARLVSTQIPNTSLPLSHFGERKAMEFSPYLNSNV